MTEEIIIDGKECVFYNNGKCDNPNGMACNCINNAVCYYKELKRLEQENERLREELNLHLYGTDDKMIHTLYGQPIQYWIEKKEALDGANSLIKGYHLLIKKYKSALEEIREIEELAYYSKGILEEPLSQRDFILDAINNYEQRRIKILNKINEVIKCQNL